MSAQLDFHPETGHQAWLAAMLAKAAAEAGSSGGPGSASRRSIPAPVLSKQQHPRGEQILTSSPHLKVGEEVNSR